MTDESDQPDEPMPGDVEPDSAPWDEYVKQLETMSRDLYFHGYTEQVEKLQNLKTFMEMLDEQNREAMEERFPHDQPTDSSADDPGDDK